MSLTIREAQPSDLPALAVLMRALAMSRGDAATVTETQLSRLVLGRRRAAVALLAALDGQAVGFAALTDKVRLISGERGTEVTHLFVRPEQRGNGIEDALVDAAALRAEEEGHDYMVIAADAQNRDAQAACRRMGLEDMADVAGPRFFRRLGVAA